MVTGLGIVISIKYCMLFKVYLMILSVPPLHTEDLFIMISMHVMKDNIHNPAV